MKKIFLILVSIVFTNIVNAQSLIAVQSNNNVSFYSNLDSAINNAVNGDYVYIPGGSFTVAGNVLIINKSINIIGAGHYPDSTLATGITTINANIKICTGASGGSIQGIYTPQNISFGTSASDNVVNGYSISRCYIAGALMLSYDNISTNTTSQNINISENVIVGIVYLSNVPNVFFSKNIFQSHIANCNGQVIFRNNIFLIQSTYSCSSTPTFHNINSAQFFDNIITNIGCNGLFVGTCTGNMFYNNIFSTSITFPINGNTGANNITNENINDIFISHTTNTFNYANNYQLKATSLGKNAASDGTDIGLYGTAYPYKKSAVPMNPHISQNSIAPNTDAQGNLNVNIVVSAQDR